MASYAEYFAKVGYKAKYQIGDRIHGVWNKIPFVGTVGNDFLINYEEGPKVSVHLDLPIKYQDKVYNILFLKHKDIKGYRK